MQIRKPQKKNVTDFIGTHEMIKNKLVPTRLLISLGLILTSQLSGAVKLSIDNSSPLNLSGDSNYDISGQVIEFNSSDPVICLNLAGSSNQFSADVVDPNGVGQYMPLLQNIGYNIPSQTINAKLNNPSGVCVTDKGSSYGDLIFRNGFIPPAFRLEGLNDQVVRGQSLDYKIVIENIDDSVVRFDLIEYVARSPFTNSAFFESVDTWNCISHNNAGVDCNEDNVNNKLFNASIPSGGIAEIDVSRTVGASSLIGQPVDMLTAIFFKNAQNEIVDVQVISNKPTVVDNSAPVLSWVDNTGLQFTEDDSQSQSLSFNVNDNTGANLSTAYLAASIGGVNDKVMIDEIEVEEVQSGFFEVSFDVTPRDNQFTSQGNGEQIFVQIEDVFNASSNLLTLPVSIAPINDAPSFVPTCYDFTINPTPVGGNTEITCNDSVVNRDNWTYTNFISAISAGGTGNDTEDNQDVIFEVQPISGLAIQNPITIGNDPGTFIEDDLYLLLADGIEGSGSFRVRAMDDGATDVCPAVLNTDNCNTSEYSQEITFNVVAPVFYVEGTIDDLPAGDEIILRLYENGTNNPLGGSLTQGGQGVNGNETIKFTLPTPLNNNVNYEVRIQSQPDNRTCSVANGATGTINNMNVDDLFIDCDPN